MMSAMSLDAGFSDNELSKENAQISPGDLRAIEGGVRREYGGGGSGEIGYVFGCLSYEVSCVGSRRSHNINIHYHTSFYGGKQGGVEVGCSWCEDYLVHVCTNRSLEETKCDVCMLLCIMCNVFIAVFAIYQGFHWQGLKTFKIISDFVIPPVVLEGFLGVLSDNLRVAYSNNKEHTKR
ncbi:hypothetical protein Q1695_013951 [Nippostrongylus brasiliensis]|nr:hypothetical protein Q1695_013951 [Nippostrongylus brasiliensis]